ncbi:MAG: hypothetical protein K9M54_10415 [Kiritimatiellales bacterium]|nr:hypothetical protein [Kiritimatiellales bacterium]MCF7863741.1 hypothetical protein [Kiritimatiellales bacterium]
MFPANTDLSSTEMDVLRMVHDLYGKRHHHARECFINDEGEKLIFIKKRNGEAQFAVNITLLARIRHIFTIQFQEKYLMPDLAGKPHLPSGDGDPACEYYTFLDDQLRAASAKQNKRLAS